MSRLSLSALPLEIREQIDAQCCAFEEAWSSGQTPELEEYLEQIDDAGRPYACQELVAIEANYRRGADGARLTEIEVIQLHAGQIPTMRHEGDFAGLDGTGRLGQSNLAGNEADESRKRNPRPPGSSHGLHIRCPHCSNPVELLVDTPYDAVKCSTCGSAIRVTDQGERTCEAAPLKEIGRFKLISRLGFGGFGSVWKALDTELDRTVAIKIPRKGQLSATEVEQFFREARSAAQLRHPNIVPVHEVGREQDTIFIVSDLIRGVSLSDWMSNAPGGFQRLAEMAAVIADALHHAHQHGVVHRDLKPSNVMVDELGQPHLMDFGLAKRDVGEITLTIDGHILGTPAYMSPEQARGHGHWTDGRTDVYSLGVILFRMLTGELPFRGNAQMQIYQRLAEDAPNPRRLNRHIPRDVATICLKCLEREPNRRYASASQLADDLRRFLAGVPIQARPVSRTQRVVRWTKRQPALAVAAALTLVLAVAGPTAALMIERGRQRLSEVVLEKDNLIGQYAIEKQRAVELVSSLRTKLAIWEGGADPWAFWSPDAMEKPRRTILADVADQRIETLQLALTSGKHQGEDQVVATLCLAILQDELGHVNSAIQNYDSARHLLVKLIEAHPRQPQLRRALADSLLQLARLDKNQDNDQDGSTARSLHLAKASEIFSQLPRESKTPAVYVEQIDTDLRLTFAHGKKASKEQLSRIARTREELAENMPTQPSELYRLICMLVRRAPILLE